MSTCWCVVWSVFPQTEPRPTGKWMRWHSELWKHGLFVDDVTIDCTFEVLCSQCWRHQGRGSRSIKRREDDPAATAGETCSCVDAGESLYEGTVHSFSLLLLYIFSSHAWHAGPQTCSISCSVNISVQLHINVNNKLLCNCRWRKDVMLVFPNDRLVHICCCSWGRTVHIHCSCFCNETARWNISASVEAKKVTLIVLVWQKCLEI